MSVSSSPFVTNSPYGNPNFTPVKIGTRSNTANESKSSSKISKPMHQEKHASASVNRYNRKKNQNEGKVTMQIEEEEDLDEYSVKHVAASRYLRNHRLINEVFSDTCVPDMRNFVNTERMIKLKGQVQSLTQHQKRLEAEVKQINEKFENKKRKFIESSERFQAEMKRMCSKKIDSAMYQEMVDQAIEQLKLEQQKKRDELNKKQDESTKNQQINNNVIENISHITTPNLQRSPNAQSGQQQIETSTETKKTITSEKTPVIEEKTVTMPKNEIITKNVESVVKEQANDKLSSDKPTIDQTIEKTEIDSNNVSDESSNVKLSNVDIIDPKTESEEINN